MVRLTCLVWFPPLTRFQGPALASGRCGCPCQVDGAVSVLEAWKLSTEDGVQSTQVYSVRSEVEWMILTKYSMLQYVQGL